MKPLLFTLLLLLSPIIRAGDVIVFERGDGGVSVVYPCPGLDVKEVLAKDVPVGARYKIVDGSEIPTREFRNAWIYNPEGKSPVSVNLSAAKQLEVVRLRNKMASALGDIVTEPDATISAKKSLMTSAISSGVIEASQNEAELKQAVETIERQIREAIDSMSPEIRNIKNK